MVAAEVGKALVPSGNLTISLRFARKTLVFFSDNTATPCQFSVSHLGNHDPVLSADSFQCFCARTQKNGVLVSVFFLHY